jgi:hypothetical protein
VLLFSPVIVLMVCLLFTLIPGGSEFLSKVFQESLGGVHAFRYASRLLMQGVNDTLLSPGQFFSSLVGMIRVELMDALILGAAMFLLKSTATRFSQRFLARYTQPEWVLSVIGVALGVILLDLRGMIMVRLQTSLSVVVTIGCLVFGIVYVLTNGKAMRRGGSFLSRMLSTLIGMLVTFLGNGVTAFCAVLLITCGMEGPRFIQAGGSLFVWLLWCLLSAGVLYLSEFILRAFRR